MNSAACAQLSGTPITGTWYRAVDPKYLSAALSTVHTPATPSRFSPGRLTSPSFRTLYLAQNQMVALFEGRALFGSPLTPGGLVPHPLRPLVTLPITISLTSVVDLTDPAEAKLLDTNAQELTGDWRSYATRNSPAPSPNPHVGIPSTHSLGVALHGLRRHQGLITYSATVPDYKILVVFPDLLAKGSPAPDFLQYSYHDHTGTPRTVRIP